MLSRVGAKIPCKEVTSAVQVLGASDGSQLNAHCEVFRELG